MSATEAGDPYHPDTDDADPRDADAQNSHDTDPGDTERTDPERGDGEPERPDAETRAAQSSGAAPLPPPGPLPDPLAWRPVKAPSLLDLEILARQVYAGLPDRFRSLCEDLVIQVEDFASDEVLDDMEIESPFDLMGLFQGVGLPFRSESVFHMPNMIWLYRRSILDYWAEHDETLGAIVAHVLVHEIGHHFGLSDDDMEAIESGAG
jgi:predicted Zn-dependent protease with MMP-like domain